MSAWDDVHIKQQVEISANILTENYTFGSIINRKNDNFFTFKMPSSQHSPKVFKKGMPISLSIQTDNNTLNFTAEVALLHPGNPPSVQVNRPNEATIQVRSKGSEYGMKDVIPLTYRVMRDPVTPISDTKKAKTVSIGPGDVVLSLINKVNKDNYIEVNYSLPPDDTAVTLVGKVIDCYEVKMGAQVSYEAHVKYEVIRPGEQDKIVKYIFDRQRSLRKRGMY